MTALPCGLYICNTSGWAPGLLSSVESETFALPWPSWYRLTQKLSYPPPPQKKVDGGQRGNQPTNQAVEIMICTCIVYVLSRPCIDNTPTRDFLQHSSLLTLMYLYLWQSSSTSSFTARKLHFFAASEFQEKSKYLAQVEVKISAPKMMTKRWPQVSCPICWDSTSAKLWNIGTNFCRVLRPTSIMDRTLFNHSRLPISCKEAPLNIWRRFKPYE